MKESRNNQGSDAARSNGKNLFSGSSDGTVKIWDLVARRAVTTLEVTTMIRATFPEIRTVALSPDGKTLAAGLRYAALLAQRTASGEVQSLACSPDGRQLAVGCWSKQLEVWNMPASGAGRE